MCKCCGFRCVADGEILVVFFSLVILFLVSDRLSAPVWLYFLFGGRCLLLLILLILITYISVFY